MRLSSLLFAAAVSAVPTTTPATTAPAQQPIAPKQDPWYSAPSGLEAASPGQVLKTRKAPGSLTSVVGNSSAAYNVLYRTTDSLGGPTWAVTTLFVPKLRTTPCTVARPGVGSLLSYQIAYDSANLNDSPSYGLYASPPVDIANALGKGWFVNVPDYEGPLASFTAGHMSGYATLDSIRAVRSANLGIAKDAHCAMWGYSGGALASEWAAELQAAHAPELKINGVALGGLTPNITSVLLAVNKGLGAYLAAEGIIGLSTQHPDTLAALQAAIKTTGPYNVTGLFAVQDTPSGNVTLEFAGQDLGAYFNGGLDAVLGNPVVQKAINDDGIMGRQGVPRMPVLAYKAIGDETSPVEDTDNLVKALCAKGAAIQYLRNKVGGHIAEATNGAAAATEFLDQVMAGKVPFTTCETKDVDVEIATYPVRRWAMGSNNAR